MRPACRDAVTSGSCGPAGETASGLPWRAAVVDHSALVETAARTAQVEGLPLVIVMASPGADIVEGIAALEGWGRLAKSLVDCSGVVPTIIVVDGPAVSGPALLLGVADLVVMTAASYGFVNGPVMVEEFTGVRVTTDELGGAGELARHTGVPSLVVPTKEAAARGRRRAARATSPTAWTTSRRGGPTRILPTARAPRPGR